MKDYRELYKKHPYLRQINFLSERLDEAIELGSRGLQRLARKGDIYMPKKKNEPLFKDKELDYDKWRQAGDKADRAYTRKVAKEANQVRALLGQGPLPTKKVDISEVYQRNRENNQRLRKMSDKRGQAHN